MLSCRILDAQLPSHAPGIATPSPNRSGNYTISLTDPSTLRVGSSSWIRLPCSGSNGIGLQVCVTSQRITGIRAICYIPGVPTYHPTLSRPCSGLHARLRGIPGILPTPRFSPHNSVHPSSAVDPSGSRLPLCYVTKPNRVALEAWRKRDSTVVPPYCPRSTTVAAPC